MIEPAAVSSGPSRTRYSGGSPLVPLAREPCERLARGLQQGRDGSAHVHHLGRELPVLVNRVYFEKRSFSSSGSRVSLTQRRSAMTKGSRFRCASKSATRRVRCSALAWQ